MSLFYYINLIKHKKLWLFKIVGMPYNLERREYLPIACAMVIGLSWIIYISKYQCFRFLLKEHKVFWPHNFGYKCLTLLSDMRATVPRDPISSLNPATCYIYSHLFNYSKRFGSDHEISRKVTKKVKNKKIIYCQNHLLGYI